MNIIPVRLSIAMLVAALTIGCGGGGNDSPSSSSATSPTSGSVAITVNSLSGSVERTSTGVTYHVTFTLRAVGSIGATVTALRVNLTNGTRSGFATFDGLADHLAAGGTFDERLGITSTNDTDLYSHISSVVVTYTDARGVSGVVTSESGVISAPPVATPTPTPACSYSVSPSTLTLGATGSFAKGTIQITTTSGCAWTVGIADGWLTAKPTSGAGTGSVAVEATGSATSNRTTRLTVGGSTVQVTQTGASTPPPTPPPSPITCNLGPYTWDANPNVLRCRNRLGQFAPSECCGR